jgi:hypothetical protein
MRGGVKVSKAKLLSIFVTALPLALTAAKLCLGGTGTGGFGGGGGIL